MKADEVKSASTAEEDSVVTEIRIAAPPERVFKALTDQGELMRWFTDKSCPVHHWEMDARLGGHYRYFTSQETASVHGVQAFECHGEILEFDPPRVLAYTWVADWHADKQHPTVVRWELIKDAAGTRVKVTHSGLANERLARKDYRGGWSGVVKMLKSFLEGSF
ncbi:MAG: hypothetical protein DMG67_14800 [Acidobacteria bacterium]|nr:MAG: hypothetical protein DMG67_14800 [Acidobacteriota bacterium]